MGAYTELVDFTLTANETSRTFSGLSITKDDFVKIVFLAVTSSAAPQFAIFPNTAAGVSSNTTLTNYHRQAIFASGTSVSAARSNTNVVNATNSSQSLAIIYAKVSENGKWNTFSNYTNQISSSVIIAYDYTTSSNLTFSDPITSLTFTASVANGLGTGSRIQIYRLDAEKVADITVTSNTTQVDISNLSIDKDSEYLLVSDILNSGAQTAYDLMVNDNTTLTNYNSQRLLGNGSSAAAARNNAATIGGVFANNRIMIHSHIKLSNIGAYTSQNYDNREYGTSGVILEHRFVSSTAENITSITKLNIVSDVSNGIAAGSRFILYKLYE